MFSKYVIVPGGVLKSNTIIRECNTRKNLTGCEREKIIKKTITESGIFRENAVNKAAFE